MRVLFLCMQMNSGFHGSMLHVLEYAEYFIQKNADVHIGSVFISEENRKIAEDRGIHVILFLLCTFSFSPTWFAGT